MRRGRKNFRQGERGMGEHTMFRQMQQVSTAYAVLASQQVSETLTCAGISSILNFTIG
jgi:hypothetical protein